jgi:hypothetical protein
MVVKGRWSVLRPGSCGEEKTTIGRIYIARKMEWLKPCSCGEEKMMIAGIYIV